jgi:hypothetical protein
MITKPSPTKFRAIPKACCSMFEARMYVLLCPQSQGDKLCPAQSCTLPSAEACDDPLQAPIAHMHGCLSPGPAHTKEEPLADYTTRQAKPSTRQAPQKARAQIHNRASEDVRNHRTLYQIHELVCEQIEDFATPLQHLYDDFNRAAHNAITHTHTHTHTRGAPPYPTPTARGAPEPSPDSKPPRNRRDWQRRGASCELRKDPLMDCAHDVAR